MSKIGKFALVLFNVVILVSIGALVWFLHQSREENRKFSSLMLEKTEANRNSINFISAGMSLSEQRLRKVMQTERIISYYNPKLKPEFVNSLAMIIVDVSSKYPNLSHIDVCALIATESRFDPNATSRVGAKGLMQLMDQTAEFICNRFAWAYIPGISFDPEKNIIMGVFYLNYLIEWNKGDKEVALVNYNGGQIYSEIYKILRSGDSTNTLSIPEETRNYPGKIGKTGEFIREKFGYLNSEGYAQGK